MLDRTQLDLWFGTKGPSNANIIIVGESWGSEEARAQRPFVGSSGTELNRILAHAGLNPLDILFTNVVAAQPQGNETWRFFEPKATWNGTRIGGLAPTDLVRSELSRLYRQILHSPRSLVIATGNYALWALSSVTGSKVLAQSNGRPIAKELQTWAPSGIMDWRGSMCYCEPHEAFFSPGMSTSDFAHIQLLPIVHPAAIMRAWYMRDPTIHDLKTRVPLALKKDWRPPMTSSSPPLLSNSQQSSKDGSDELIVPIRTEYELQQILKRLVASSPASVLPTPQLSQSLYRSYRELVKAALNLILSIAWEKKLNSSISSENSSPTQTSK
jgi:uracil-DNA glycosylase